jgi:hypothetical protein
MYIIQSLEESGMLILCIEYNGVKTGTARCRRFGREISVLNSNGGGIGDNMATMVGGGKAFGCSRNV